MAAILALLGHFVGPAIKVGKFIYEPIKRELNYLCCFNNNVQNLRDEAEKLKDKRDGLQMTVDAEVNNAGRIDPEVTTWLGKASNNQAKMSEIETEITDTQNSGFSLKSRYSLGKKVKKTTEEMKRLRGECHFDFISHPALPAALVAARPLESYSVFESRKEIEEGVMRSLRDGGTHRVGICGMGGVGKTTLAKKIMHQAREENLFEEISMVTVSKTVDTLKIQNELAGSLGLKLGDESFENRSNLLRTRLSGSKRRSLIVVDDVWENLNLEELGIPCNSVHKVLLTSRNTDVLTRMNVEKEKVHALKVLSEIEAWDLFTVHVGSCIKDQNLMSVAREVARECKGLPVALVALGEALKDVGEPRVWRDYLHQLKSNNPISLPEYLEHVFIPLKLSYDRLQNEEAQSLFLLCSLYPEDAFIPLEELTIYAMGLGMLRGITSLETARDRVWSLVERLKIRFLLLESTIKDHVKMHDVIRDVAIFIADEKKLIACDSNTNDCTLISPHIGKRMDLHDGSIVFPNLRLLCIDRGARDKELEIDNQFFEGMKELNVFSIKFPSFQQLPQTTRILSNLKSLVLEQCESLENISIVGELVNLEILICCWCESIECLPREIGRLRRLKLLVLFECDNLKTIAPGIISNLKELEELIIEHSFDGWEAETGGEEGKNASLKELEQLSSLSRLEIEIEDPRLASQQMHLSSNIVRYHIQIGSLIEKFLLSGEKIMELNLPRNTSFGNWIDELVRRAEILHLKGDGSNLDFGAAQNIKLLHLRECSMVKKLVSMKATNPIFPLLEILTLQELSELKEICDIDWPIPSNFLSNLKELTLESLLALEHLNVVSNFNNLSSIYVYRCDRLQSLFSSSMMTRVPPLVQLKSLRIKSCDMMEHVFVWNHEENRIPLVFLNLKSLELHSLPRLTSFSRGFESVEFSVLEELEITHCPLKNFSCSSSSIEDDDVVHILCKHDKVKLHYPSDMRIRRHQIPLNFFFYGLCKLEVSGLNGLKNLFSLSTTKSSCLSQLETLDIKNCDMLEEVILWNEESNNSITLFPKLMSLKLNSLPRLTSFSRGIEHMEFPMLHEMQLVNCRMRTFVFIDSSTRCPNRDDDAIHLFCQSDKLKFDNLSKLELRCYQNDDMRTWCPRIPHDFFARLSQLKIYGFNSMKSLFSSSTIKSGCLSQLEELVISECQMMEEIILWDEEENPMDIRITQFQKLEILTLHSMPRLTSLSKGIQFTPPAEMNIYDCPLLESCASTTSSDDYIHLFCKTDKVGFDSLKKLYIGGYDSTSIIWCPRLPMIEIFSWLTELQIARIQGRKSLFSYSVARSLHNMKWFYISECEEMVRVIEDEACGGETPPIHLFPHLEELCLTDLPKLKSFCEWRCPLEFPFLIYLEISGCGVMEKFTSGPLHTPILKTIFTDKARSFGINNLNALLQLKREEEQKAIGGCSVEMEEQRRD